MELYNIGDSVAVVHRLFVGVIELDGDAKVAADDDDRRHDEVERDHGDHKREALMLHLVPGKRARQAEGLRAVPPPAQYGEQSPEQCVQPGPQAQHLHLPPADFLLCREKEKGSKTML